MKTQSAQNISQIVNIHLQILYPFGQLYLFCNTPYKPSGKDLTCGRIARDSKVSGEHHRFVQVQDEKPN